MGQGLEPLAQQLGNKLLPPEPIILTLYSLVKSNYYHHATLVKSTSASHLYQGCQFPAVSMAMSQRTWPSGCLNNL